MKNKPTVKLFLDDVRYPPNETWTLVRSVEDCLYLLLTSKVSILSLDHDMGEGEPTGLDLAKKMGSLPSYHWPRTIYIHSMNPVGKNSMADELYHTAPPGVSIYKFGPKGDD